MFTGAMTAMVTPFSNREVDEARLRNNVSFQIDHGISGLVPCGTTGESPTLSHDEHRRVVAQVVEAANGRVPVIAGAGSNSTAEALELTQHAKSVGAAATLQVNPYYNKPTQEGLYRHFATIADAVDLPMVLYNIPGRSVVELSPETIERLAAHPNIVATKEATGSMDVASQVIASTDLTVLSGDDSLTLPLMSIGARGVISVFANIAPKWVTAMTDAALAGDFVSAREQHLSMFPLCKAMFLETNPIPVKTAMKLLGADSGEMRLPMCEMSEANTSILRDALRDGKLL
ncbi:MAG: 4-hydroxy-tetrahydrodipicolinate synthase [Planctomycetaceae bacterium]|nr:4-hydroxy-tetrahydrodipicolinate synthase [Planctomycetaceae bacterium]